MKYFHLTLATFFGVGKIPGAPGTWGSLAAVPIFYPLLNHPVAYGILLVLLFGLGVYSANEAEKILNDKDPSCVVIDEVVGMGISMFLLPYLSPYWPYAVMAFVLFRLFDIGKPYPIWRLEKVPGGWGIMLDDVVAGLYANLWVQIGAFVVHYIA